jgi:hypothetical protein
MLSSFTKVNMVVPTAVVPMVGDVGVPDAAKIETDQTVYVGNLGPTVSVSPRSC